MRQGVLVEDVEPNGPAAMAGLLPGDVLLSLGAEAIHNLRDLYRAEYALSAGSPVELAVMRGPDVQLLRITPAAPRKAQPALSAGSVTEKDNLVFRLGLYGATLTPALASTLGGLRSDAGVLVLALAGVGLTGQNAIEPADVVRAVNGTTRGHGRSSAEYAGERPRWRSHRAPDRAGRHALLRHPWRHTGRRAAPQKDEFHDGAGSANEIASVLRNAQGVSSPLE